MRNVLAVLVALAIATDLAAALSAPAEERFLGAGDGRWTGGTFCGSRLAAVLEGVGSGDVWTMAAHIARFEGAALGCTVATHRTFRGPLVLSEGGCLAASDGAPDWLCLDPVFGRVDLGVHWDICYRIDPCAYTMHGDVHVVAAP